MVVNADVEEDCDFCVGRGPGFWASVLTAGGGVLESSGNEQCGRRP